MLRTLLRLPILLLSVCVCRLVFLEIVGRETSLLVESLHPAKLIFSLREIRPRLFDDFRSRGHRSLLVLSASKRTLCDSRLHRELKVRRINDCEHFPSFNEIPLARPDASHFARH